MRGFLYTFAYFSLFKISFKIILIPREIIWIKGNPKAVCMKIFVLCGEISGDQLAGKILTSLKNQDPSIGICGIGGRSLEGLGLESLFPMSDLSVMGVSAVLLRLPILWKRLRQTVEAIHKIQPDIVLTVDAPDFNFRVIKILRKKGYTGKCIHVVAPSVWAWRPNRAQYIAKIYNHLMCLLPFEPPYFEKEGLKTTFIGHPIADHSQQKHTIKKISRLLLLPGSRKSEITRHMPLFIEVCKILHLRFPALKFHVIATPGMEALIESYFDKTDHPYICTKRDIQSLASDSIALAVSGTVTLELAQQQIPSVVVYKTSLLTYMIAKKLVKVAYVSLINIVAQKFIYSELIQKSCCTKNIVNELCTLLTDLERCKKQQRDIVSVMPLMKNPTMLSSAEAGKNVILRMMKNQG